jgi:hypothetical protein
MTGTELDLGRLADIVAKFHRIPDEVRRFTVTTAAARSRHRIDPGLLQALLDAGMPSVGTGSSRLFDDYDLGNAALHLGLMSIRRMAARSWAYALRQNSQRGRSAARVGFAPRCPVPGHPGLCPFGLLRPGGRRRIVPGTGNGTDVLSHLDVELRGSWPVVGPAVRSLVEEIADVEFFILPEAIRWDPQFMLSARIADCGAAKWLAHEARRRGLAARFSFGLLVTSPYSTPHCWAEFKTDGIWVPVDPLLLKTIEPVNRSQWPLHRSTGAIVSRLGGRFTKLAAHQGIWCPVSLPTQCLA